MDRIKREEWTARVLAYLSHAEQRCTYHALAGILRVHDLGVWPYLGKRHPHASRVVRKDTGPPTGYAPDQLAKGLCDGPKPINCPKELRQLMELAESHSIPGPPL